MQESVPSITKHIVGSRKWPDEKFTPGVWTLMDFDLPWFHIVALSGF